MAPKYPETVMFVSKKMPNSVITLQTVLVLPLGKLGSHLGRRTRGGVAKITKQGCETY